MLMSAPTLYTAEMVRALPDDGNKYEVVYGELLVTPAPRVWHELVQSRLAFEIGAYLRDEPAVGTVLGPLGDISWDETTLVQPDVFVVCPEEIRTLDWASVKDLLLIAEVLSPSTARFDRVVKRRRYQEAGVPLYWIIDGDAKCAEIWTPESRFPRIEYESLVWYPENAKRPFMLQLHDLFRPV
jgi:Uma2 family endonuclease